MEHLDFVQFWVELIVPRCELELMEHFLFAQGPRPGFFPDDKSQKKGAGLSPLGC